MKKETIQIFKNNYGISLLNLIVCLLYLEATLIKNLLFLFQVSFKILNLKINILKNRSFFIGLIMINW